MFGWLFVSRREFLAMVSRTEEAIAKIEARIEAEHEQVQERVSALLAQVLELKEQVLAGGMSEDALVAKLEAVAEKVELIYVPEAVVEPEVVIASEEVVVAEPVYEVEEDPAEDVPEPLDDEPTIEDVVE